MIHRLRADIASRAARRLPATRALLVLAGALAAGCSLLPGPPPAPRVYQVPLSDGPAAREETAVSRLRVRTVSAAAHLDKGIVWRSGVQLGHCPGVRWSERPEVVLQHALLARLFSDGRLVRSEALDAPVLDVDLLAFEEVLDDGGDVALVELRARVLNESRDEVLSIDCESRQPFDADGDRFEVLAQALGAALDAVCTRLTTDIAHALAR